MMAYDGMLWIMIYGHHHGIVWYFGGTMLAPQLKVGLYTLLGLAISIINNIVMGVKNKISYLGGGPTLYKYHNL